MQDDNHICESEIKQILITEGWLQNVPRLASVGGLAAALTFSGPAQAKSTKNTNVRAVQPVAKTKSSKVSTDSLFDYISQWEGLRTKMYKDHAGNPTIGIGHYLNGSEADRKLINAIFDAP
jgi:hypothetical protein